MQKVVTYKGGGSPRLPGKGHIAEGFDADILLLDDAPDIKYVFANGRMMMENWKIFAKGTFEE